MPTRNQTILKLRRNGQTLQAIGERYTLSRERVRQILAEQGYPATRRTPKKEARLESLYTFLIEYMTAHHGLPPTLEEIGTQLNFSKSMAHLYLKHLARQGRICFTGFSASRAYYLPGSQWTPPQD